MKSAFRSMVYALLRQVPLPVWRRLFPKSPVGICYHIISGEPVAHVRHYPVLDIATFEADLLYLRRTHGFITYDQLVQRRSGMGTVRDNAAMITFDDGFSECATIVAPILRRVGASGVFFIITDLIDNAAVFRETEAALCISAICRLPPNEVEAVVADLGLDERLVPPPLCAPSYAVRLPLDVSGLSDTVDRRLLPLLHWLLTVEAADLAALRQLSLRLGIDPEDYVRSERPYMTAQQIGDLHAQGFTIGAHSLSHRWLSGLPRAEAEREVVESCRVIRDLTGQAEVPFAFPYSGDGIDREWLAQLRREQDFIGLFFDTGGLREDAPHVVQRVFGERIGHDRTPEAILRRAWSRPPAWRLNW